jgi:hypothetical protein
MLLHFKRVNGFFKATLPMKNPKPFAHQTFKKKTMERLAMPINTSIG